MSWCGGGEISPTPGVECRTLPMYSSTLWPGSWPPSPGLAPCAILICNSSALTRYSAVTPKRALATCLIALRRHLPVSSLMNRIGGKSDTGEGGEEPERYKNDENGHRRRTGTKEVASASLAWTR